MCFVFAPEIAERGEHGIWGELNILLTTVLRIQSTLKCSWRALMPPD
jgi:hypothetical protein